MMTKVGGNMRLFYFVAFSFVCLIFAHCALAADESTCVLYANACEKISKEETISSIRLRAADKATFLAVQNLDEIKNLASNINEHDKNVIIYDIVDNYVEDLSIQTTKQDNDNICVEVSGFVSKDNIAFALENFSQPQNILDKNEGAEPQTDFTQPEQNNTAESAPNQEKILSIEKNNIYNNEEKALLKNNNKKLFIAPLEFYNNTRSQSYAKILQKVFEQNPYFDITQNSNEADYIIRSKVLRAKVDSINSQKNRMQMVVMVEAEFVDNKSSVTEHQNQFILFNAHDDEQKVAAQLMQKLLTKAGKIILKKVQKNAQVTSSLSSKKENFSMITPEN